MAIPEDVRDRLSKDPFMQYCCVADQFCEGRIEWNHALIFAGVRQQFWWCILPMCHYHHEHTDRPDIRTQVNAVMRIRSNGELDNFEKVHKFI